MKKVCITYNPYLVRTTITIEVYRSNCRKEHIENANVHWGCDRFKTLNGKIGHRKPSIGQIAG